MKKLYKAKFDKMAAGVCGGLGHYFKIDPTFIRLIVVFVCIFTGIVPVLLLYLLAALIIPKEKTKYVIKQTYKKLYRSTKDRKIAGICSGLGDFLKIDTTFIRFIMVILCIFTGFIFIILIYLVGWVIIPEK